MWCSYFQGIFLSLSVLILPCLLQPLHLRNLRRHLLNLLLLLQQSSSSKQTEPSPFLSDVISYYVRTGLQPVYFTIYFVKVGRTEPLSVESPQELLYWAQIQ